MAVMHPDRFPAAGPDSERKVYSLLGGLSDDWHIFHDVAWQSSSAGESGDGQADFVLLHPTYGVTVLEVKGGGIDVDGGQYVSVDGNGVRHIIRNPFTQARTSKHVLLDYLKACFPDLPFLGLAHGVVFSDVADPPLLGPEAPREIVIDRRDLRDVGSAIDRLQKYWETTCRLEVRHVERIVSALAPTTSIRPLLRDDVADAYARLIRLTEDQYRVLRQIRLNRQALIYGGAGTGKTLLAVERARQLSADGFRVLLTCYNRALGEFLASNLAQESGIKVARFHELCFSETRKAALPWPRDPDEAWFDRVAPDLLVDAASITGFEVDAVVVDEGQDFAPAWWETLRMLMADPTEGPFYVFADHHQAIYRHPDGWEPPFDGFVFELTTNCRNTLPIADRVAGIYGDELDTLGAPGPEPEYVAISSFADAVREARRVLVRLLQDEGLSPQQVTVLTASVSLANELRAKPVATHQLVETGGSGLVVDTFHSFKGLEADVVVAILPDFQTRDLVEQHRALSYIGLSRARAHLIVLGRPEAKAEIAWSVG